MPDFLRIEDDGIVRKVFVTLSNGREVQCNPVARQFALVGSSIADPPGPAPPQYTITGVGGAKEKRDHDAESIKDPKTNDKEKAAWAKYLKRLASWQAKVDLNADKREAMNARFLSLRAVTIPDIPQDLVAWAEEQETLYGIAPDKDNGLSPEINARLLYAAEEIFSTEDDGKRIVLGVVCASGLDKETTDQMVSMFWDTVGDDGETGADTTRDTAGAKAAQPEEGGAGVVADPPSD